MQTIFKIFFEFVAILLVSRFGFLIMRHVRRTWHFHCRGPEFYPWSGTEIPQARLHSRKGEPEKQGKTAEQTGEG